MRFTKPIQFALLGFAAAAVALTLRLPRLENITWDVRVRFFASGEAPSPRIRLILVDQYSLDWGKQKGWPWPWPREAYAALLEFCQRQGAVAVGFDMILTEPSGAGVDDDQRFGEAIRSGAPFVGAMFPSMRTGETNWPAGVREQPARRMMAPILTVVPRATCPIPEVATNAFLLASVEDQPDADGIFRRATAGKNFAGRLIPGMGPAMLLAGDTNVTLRVLPERETHGMIGGVIPVNRAGRAILRYKNDGGGFEFLTAAAVIESELRIREGAAPVLKGSNLFANAFVLFGCSAPGLMDLRSTPISKVAPGVLIHATMLDNLLTNLFFRDAPALPAALLTLLLALLAAALASYSRRAWQTVGAFIICLPLPWVVGFAAYAGGLWWPVVASELAVLLALTGAVIVNYATEGRQKAFIKGVFRHYLSPEVIEQIIADPARLKLGGEKRELTIFFSDLQGFSSFSEKLGPEELTTLLNEYLTDMTDIILAEGGTLDKYEGDAIIAFWNAPLAMPDHAARACRAALLCQRKLAERRAGFQAKYGAALHMRIGMNTGAVVVGNMGSHSRFNYTILGDAANLASRLEGANKAFGTYLMVSDRTWSLLNGSFAGRMLARLRVVGRAEPVAVYELTGLPGEATPRNTEAFEAARRQFEAGDFQAAQAAFEQIPDDPAARAYAVRCQELTAHPPTPWAGVWVLSEK